MSKKIMRMLLALLFTFPLGGLLLCLRVITVNIALVTSDNSGQVGCIVGDDLTNLLEDIDVLISCQISIFTQEDGNSKKLDTFKTAVK
jgi:hypothetical protein